MKSAISHEISLLDFLRGWAAIIVFFHHASILGGGPSILSGHVGREAVNAFMLASGFLIFFQSEISKTYFGLRTFDGIKNFYVRRFFRIAPAYYFTLVISLLLSEYLGECREQIAEILPNTATSMDRYYITSIFKNFLIHITFIFGLLPSYSFSTPLPDWSLGLEMQFYFIFPLIFFFYKRNFPLYFVISLILMFGLWKFTNQLNIKYHMPSFLPLSFHNFAAGMSLAFLYLNKDICIWRKSTIITITLVFLLVGNKTFAIPILFILSWWWLCVKENSENTLVRTCERLFNHRSSKFLAEMSYSVYIVHLIIMLPFFSHILIDGKIPLEQWIFYTLTLLTITVLVSYLIYKHIEIPGINIGKKLLLKNKEHNIT